MFKSDIIYILTVADIFPEAGLISIFPFYKEKGVISLFFYILEEIVICFNSDFFLNRARNGLAMFSVCLCCKGKLK